MFVVRLFLAFVVFLVSCVLLAASPGGLSVAEDAYGPGAPPGAVAEPGSGLAPEGPAGPAPEQALASQESTPGAVLAPTPEDGPVGETGQSQGTAGSAAAPGSENPSGASQELAPTPGNQLTTSVGPTAGAEGAFDANQAAAPIPTPGSQVSSAPTSGGESGGPAPQGQAAPAPTNGGGSASNGQEPAQEGTGPAPEPPSVSEAAYPEPEEGPPPEPPPVPPPLAESVRDAVYPPSVVEAVYRPEPPYPVPGLKVVREPPPFRARRQAVVEAALRSDLPVLAILDRVEGLPGTVSAAVYHPEAGIVAEVRGETVIRAVYFRVAGEVALEFRLAGWGRIDQARFHFKEVPAE